MFYRSYHHLHLLNFESYVYLHILLSPAIFMDTNGIHKKTGL